LNRRPTVNALVRLLAVAFIVGLKALGVVLWNSIQSAAEYGIWSQVDSVARLDARLWEVNGHRLVLPDTSNHTLRVTLLNDAGLVLQDTSSPNARLQDEAQFPEVKAALAGQVGRAQRYAPAIRDTMMFTALPLRDERGRLRGVMRAGISTGVLRERLEVAWRTFALCFVGFALLGLALATVVSRTLTQPLARLSEMLRSGDVHPLRGSVPQEIAHLGQSLQRIQGELKEQYARLVGEHRRLEAILSRGDEGILLADPSGVVTFSNPAALRILRVSAAEIKDWPRTEPDMCSRVLAMISAGDETSTAISSPDDDRNVIVAVYAIPWAGETHGHAVFLRDVSHLVRVDRMRREFIANASHELRTPVAAVSNALEALEIGALQDSQKCGAFLERARRSVDRLARLSEGLLELSMAESSPDRPGDCDAVETAQQTIASRQSAAAARGQTLQPTLPSGPLQVAMPEDDYSRVLCNLIDNAIKYAPEGSTIEVMVKAGPKFVSVAALDTGSGIEPSDLALIFDRFYRADNVRSKPGSGLGLSIAKILVERCGGRVTAANRPGGGAAIGFEVPLFTREG